MEDTFGLLNLIVSSFVVLVLWATKSKVGALRARIAQLEGMAAPHLAADVEQLSKTLNDYSKARQKDHEKMGKLQEVIDRLPSERKGWLITGVVLGGYAGLDAMSEVMHKPVDLWIKGGDMDKVEIVIALIKKYNEFEKKLNGYAEKIPVSVTEEVSLHGRADTEHKDN